MDGRLPASGGKQSIPAGKVPVPAYGGSQKKVNDVKDGVLAVLGEILVGAPPCWPAYVPLRADGVLKSDMPLLCRST